MSLYQEFRKAVEQATERMKDPEWGKKEMEWLKEPVEPLAPPTPMPGHLHLGQCHVNRECWPFGVRSEPTEAPTEEPADETPVPEDELALPDEVRQILDSVDDPGWPKPAQDATES